MTSLLRQALSIRDEICYAYDAFYSAVNKQDFDTAVRSLANSDKDYQTQGHKTRLLAENNLFEFYCNNSNQFFPPFESSTVRDSSLRSPHEDDVDYIHQLINQGSGPYNNYLNGLLSIRTTAIYLNKCFDSILGLDLARDKNFESRCAEFSENLLYTEKIFENATKQLCSMANTREKQRLLQVIASLNKILNNAKQFRNKLQSILDKNDKFDLLQIANQHDLSGAIFRNLHYKQQKLNKLLQRHPHNPKNKAALEQLQKQLIEINKMEAKSTQASNNQYAQQIKHYYRVSSLCYQISKKCDPVNDNMFLLRVKQFLFLITLIGPIIKYFMTDYFNFNKRSVTEYGLREQTPLLGNKLTLK